MVSLKKAKEILSSHGVLVYPTETAYGIGCDARNASAIKKIGTIKGREHEKPFAVIASSRAMVQRFFVLDGAALRLATLYWPGALTLILPVKNSEIRRALGLTHIGVRVSAHPVARAISRSIDAPIVSTSANVSGREMCFSLRDVDQSFGDNVDLFVIDGGTLKKRKASTLVKCDNVSCEIFRQGAVKIPRAFVKHGDVGR